MEVAVGEVYRFCENGKLYIVNKVSVNEKSGIKEITYSDYDSKHPKTYITAESFFLSEVNYDNYKQLPNSVNQKIKFERIII